MMLPWPWARFEWRAVCAERCTYGSGRRSANALLTPLKVIGWGWFYLSTILDDFSRYIIAWKLCTSMKVDDVTDTSTWHWPPRAVTRSRLNTAFACYRTTVRVTSPPILANGWRNTKIDQVHGAPGHPQTQGKIERWHQTLKNRILLENYFFSGRPRSANRGLRRSLQSSTISRKPRQFDPSRRLLRTRPDHPARTRKDQTRHNQTATLEPPSQSSLNQPANRAGNSILPEPQKSQIIRRRTWILFVNRNFG
jgi:transposase InsO family protein